MSDLVNRLCRGKHTIEFEPRTESSQEIRDRINNGFVFIKFVDTKGGTEIGINLDKSKTNFSLASFENNSGPLKIIGTCILDFTEVECCADIDLNTRKGLGYVTKLS